MKKILLSVAVIAAVAAVVVGVTTAFFSDTETSTGNTFTAGSLDLKISNTSYIKDHETGRIVYNQGTSWTAKDLDGEKFFNFSDVKPGDVGEDTIDLTVINNDAWACAKLTLTSNNDNTCTEPENDTEVGTEADCSLTGELAQGIEFVWWADDGDNVLESDEEASKYYLGPDSITNLLGNDGVLDLTFADKFLNFFDRTRLDQNQTVKPLEGGKTYYVGKGWCYGNMTLTPVAQDNNKTSGPDQRGTGFECDGGVAGNEGQTDSLTADITFTIEQARNNAGFKCPEHAGLN